MSHRIKVTNMKSVKLSPGLMNEYGLDQNSVVAIEVKGLEALQKFKEYQANGLECIAATSNEEACRFMSLFTEDARVESTCTSADGSTCAVIKPHAMKAAGNIINEIINTCKFIISG